MSHILVKIVKLLFAIALTFTAKQAKATIVVLLVTSDGLAVAADSRDSTKDASGSGFNDRICKIIQHGENSLSVFIGPNIVVTNLAGGKLFDAMDIASAVFKDQISDSQTFSLRSVEWAEKVMSEYRKPPVTQFLKDNVVLANGIFLNSISGVVEVRDVRIVRFATVSNFIKDFELRIRHKFPAVGQVDIYADAQYSRFVNEFLAGRTSQAKLAMEKFHQAFPRSSSDYDLEKLRAAVQFSIENNPGPTSTIGGKVDVALIPHQGPIRWLYRKEECKSR